MNKFFGSCGNSHFQLVGDGGVPPVEKTLIFRLLLFKQTTYISRVWTRPERWHIMLLFQSALIPQLCLHFFQKLKCYTLGNNDYSRKLIWVALAINVNAKEVKSTVSPLVKATVEAIFFLVTTIHKFSYIGSWKCWMNINNKKMIKTYVFTSINNHN